jgi:hypothetical protein
MALDFNCSTCGTDEFVSAAWLTGTQRQLTCGQCGSDWLYGQAAPPPPKPLTLDQIRRRFPGTDEVDPGRLKRAQELKSQFLELQPQQESPVAAYWAKYQYVFSADGLPSADPQDLKDFANSGVGANPGNMSVFNTAWNEMGADQGAAAVREVIDYLLRGTSPVEIEDRLTLLINDAKSVGMKGFKESLLTKVLCVIYPDKYLTILKYTGEAGKREIARSIWGLELPDPERVNWTIGRLIVWSNDLLLDLLGEGFETQQHAADFLWWAKDRA